MSEASIIAAVQALVDTAVNTRPVVIPVGAGQIDVAFTIPGGASGWRAVVVPWGTYYATGDGTSSDLCKVLEDAFNTAFAFEGLAWTCTLVGSKLTFEAGPELEALELIFDPDPTAPWSLFVGPPTIDAEALGFTEASYPLSAGGALAWTVTAPDDMPSLEHTTLVHDDLQWAGTERAFEALFVDATEEYIHAWMVTRVGYDERIRGTNNLSIGTHKIKVFGLYGVRDLPTMVDGASPHGVLAGPALGAKYHRATATKSVDDWRPIKAAVLETLRKHITLSGTSMNSGPPQVKDEGHRSFQWAFCHWVEIDLPAQERINYAAA